MQKSFRCFLALAVSLFISIGAAGADNSPGLEGFWQGVLSYREDDLPLRLEIQSHGGALEAYLDLPSLVYARQTIPVQDEGGGKVILEFPFGIGEISALLGAGGEITGARDGFSLNLRKAPPPPYVTRDISFGAFDPPLQGTLYIPEGEEPAPLVILVAGSGRANRSQWSYASWADFYARQGIAAFVYDRRENSFLLEGGAMMGMEDHASDLVHAIAILKTLPEIDPQRVGVASHSRGGWIAMALGNQVADLAFMVFLSPAPVTPAEQNVDSTLAGMDQDGLASSELEAARNYYRLYFYVSQTREGWDLLEPLALKAQETIWGQYVDQPRTLDDLRWWNANMNFDAAGNLRGLKMPVLALWGGADFITPHAKYEGIFRQNLEIGGNNDITTRVFPGADHRGEVDPGTDSQGIWHWFGMAPEVLQTLGDWIKDKTR